MTILGRCLAPACAVALAILSAGDAARAQAGDAKRQFGDTLSFSAGDIQADPNLRELTLQDHVVVTYGRYRIVSESLHLALTPGGILVDGEGRVAFCPCPDPPVAIAFSGGRVAPPGDLLVRFPRLEVLGLPVFALPWLWIRAPDRVGLLPPLIAWRGDDGLLAGAGAHLPWRGRDGALRTLDVRGAGYLEGGAEVSADLETPSTSSRASVDQIHGTRVVIDGRGALAPERDVAVAWNVDAIRGSRARSGTIDLAAAAQPYDVGDVETSIRLPLGDATGLAASGITARSWRGEGEVRLGPHAAVALGGDVGSAGAWDGELLGVALGRPRSGDAVPIASSTLGTELSARPGPLAARLGVRGRARIADLGPDVGASEDATVAARAEVSLPVARAWSSKSPGEAPTVHTVAPVVEARGAVGGARGDFFRGFGRVAPASWLGAAGASTSVGRYDGSAGRLDVRAGALGERAEGADPGVVLPVAHARLAGSWRALAVGIEAAVVGVSQTAFEVRRSDDPASTGEKAGAAAIGRARLGPERGPSIAVDAATQSGTGASEARAVADGSAAALPGDDLPYLAASGWTGGAGALIPWTATWDSSVRADADLGAGELVAIRGAAGYHHRCGCLAAVANVAHRIGRGGVDVWFSVDLVPGAR